MFSHVTNSIKNFKKSSNQLTSKILNNLKNQIDRILIKDKELLVVQIEEEKKKIEEEKEQQKKKLETESRQKLIAEEEAKAIAEQKARHENEKIAAAATAASKTETQTTSTPTEKLATIKSIKITNQKIYSERSALYTQLNTYSTNFKKDKTKSGQVFKIRNTISTAISNFSAISGVQLSKQVDQLAKIFNQQILTDSTGEILLNLSDQASLMYGAVTVVETLIKSSLVKTALDQQLDKTYIFGLAVTNLWQKSKDNNFGDLFLAILTKKCPQILPYSVEVTSNTSDLDKLGYEKDLKTGSYESLSEHKTKISSIFSLYVSLCQAPLASANEPHPHGLKNLWTWLATTLNCNPVINYSARLMFNLLDIAGFSLYKYYGQAFYAILLVVKNDFIGKVRGIGEVEYDVKKLEDVVNDLVKEFSLWIFFGLKHAFA